MNEPNLSEKVKAVLHVANQVTLDQVEYVGTEHLLYGCLCVDCEAGDLLRDAGVVKSDYEAEFFRVLPFALHRKNSFRYTL